MNSNSKLIDFLREQAKIEKEIIDSINKSVFHLENPPVKGVLEGIALDSLKHSKMYESSVMLLTRVSKALTQEDLERQKTIVEKHLKIELELIEKIGKVLPTVENKKVKLLLKAILSDVRRHHQLLKDILEILVEGETLTEADWWDMIWKDSPYHGGSGG